MNEPSEFSLQLSAITAKAAADGNAEQRGEMIERLSHALAFTIAIATKGDETAMNAMLEGASNYMYETAAGLAKFGRMMG